MLQAVSSLPGKHQSPAAGSHRPIGIWYLRCWSPVTSQEAQCEHNIPACPTQHHQPMSGWALNDLIVFCWRGSETGLCHSHGLLDIPCFLPFLRGVSRCFTERGTWLAEDREPSWRREEVSAAFPSSGPLALAPRTAGSFLPLCTSCITAWFPAGACLFSYPWLCHLDVGVCTPGQHIVLCLCIMLLPSDTLGDAASVFCCCMHILSYAMEKCFPLSPFGMCHAILMPPLPTHTHVICHIGFLSHPPPQMFLTLKAAKLHFFFFLIYWLKWAGLGVSFHLPHSWKRKP